MVPLRRSRHWLSLICLCLLTVSTRTAAQVGAAGAKRNPPAGSPLPTVLLPDRSYGGQGIATIPFAPAADVLLLPDGSFYMYWFTRLAYSLRSS